MSEKVWEVSQLFQVNLPLSRERTGDSAWHGWVQAAGQGHTAEREREKKMDFTSHRGNGQRQQWQTWDPVMWQTLTDIFVSLLRMTWRRWGGSIGGAFRCSSGLKMYCSCPYGPGGELDRSANNSPNYTTGRHNTFVSFFININTKINTGWSATKFSCKYENQTQIN